MMTQETKVRTVAGGIGVLVVGALLAVTAHVSAQGPDGTRGGGHRGHMGRGGPGGPDGPGRFGGGRFGGPLAGVRDLTEAQRDQVRDITTRHRDEMRAAATRLADARHALVASVESGQVDEGKATELGAATSALAVLRARVHAEVLGVLTPEQRAAAASRRDQMRKWLDARPDGARRDRGGRGGPGGPGGPGARGDFGPGGPR